MKGKIIKRVKRELRHLGCNKFDLKKTFGYRHQKLYELYTHYHGDILVTVGPNDIQVYKFALKLIKLEDEYSALTIHDIWWKEDLEN